MKAVLCFLLVQLAATCVLQAQETNMIQIKAFDEQMRPVSDLTISINGGSSIPLSGKKSNFYDVPKADLPPTSVKLNASDLEVESWNFSKGTLELIVRRKQYQVIGVTVQTTAGTPVPGVVVRYAGKNPVSATTSASGVAELPISLNEQPTVAQFTIAGHRVIRFTSSDKGRLLVVDVPGRRAEPDVKPVAENFDVRQLDSISSLTMFYSMLKGQNISALDAATKKLLDARFHALVSELQQSSTSEQNFTSRISDSSFVRNDVQNLLKQAEYENGLMDDFREGFDEKIQVINRKLSQGTASLNDNERENLFEELTKLEEVLKQNEDKFYKNVTDYRLMIRSLKSSFTDIKDLQEKLSASELRRLEERRDFRTKIIVATGVLLLFGALLVWSIVLRSRVVKQKKSLVKANDEIQRINENLEVLVFERSRQLVEAYKEMDIFLYRASHDLRAPICTIIGLCNLALHQTKGDADLINKISTTAVKMDGLLKKLKMISEVNQPSNYSPVYLSQIIRNVRSLFSRSVAENNIEVVVDNDATSHFYSYPDLIEIILYNLVENALFFSTLVRDRHPRIQIMASVEQNNLFLSVYDNGIGIDREERVKLWNMFYVGNEQSKGNGLGLYIVLKSVQSLNGKIDLESEPSAYTRFSLTIPINRKVTSALTRLDQRRVLEPASA